MPNKDYWIKRQEDLQDSLMNKAEDYTAEIEKGYTAAIKELEKQIAVWYQRFADNNGIDIVTAQRILNEKELAELKWDVQEYIKHGKENALDGRWMKELENASARVRISRLEALKLQARQQIEQLYGGREQSVRELTGNGYKGTLYGTGYEHFCRTGIETYFDRIDENKLNQILNKAWTVDGKNFSERIWDNKQKLINTLNNEFVRALTTGESPDKLSANIAKTMKADKSSAQTLVLTESAYFATKGQTDCYAQLDVEEYEILETLDSTTCEVCGSYDGKHYPVKSMQAGVNAPPFHPRCRGTTIPYFDDEFTEDEKRAARGQDGKTEYVDNMTFEEWKEKYVDNDVANSAESGIIKLGSAKGVSDVHTIGKIDKDIYKCITSDIITDEVIITDNQIQHILERHPDAYEKVADFLRGALENPDYIIEDKHKNTGLVIKRIKTESEFLQVVLRICTSVDTDGYKNSIIFCWKISEKRLQNYLRNKHVLYKKE